MIATVGGVAAVQWRKFRSRVAEDRRKDDLLHERKIKAQKDYDQKMKDMLGHSSIDYTKKWRLIENNINNLKAQSPHNESAINAFIDYMRLLLIKPRKRQGRMYAAFSARNSGLR